MRLRSRFLLASGAASVAIIGAITAATFWIYAIAEVRELDRELIARVQHEAENLVHSEGLMLIVHGESLAIRALDEHVKYAAYYGKDGHLIARAATFGPAAPSRADLPKTIGVAFDFDYGERRLRGVLWPVEGGELLMAASRSYLDDDRTSLGKVLALFFALGAVLSIAGAGFIASRLTRSVEHIADVARAITDGRLDTRVQASKLDSSREVRWLGSDLNAMVDSLQLALTAEQRFVSNAAHELRSPLTALRGELELTLRRERSIEDYKRALQEALEHAGALQTLAEDLLDLARTRLGPPPEGMQCDIKDAVDAAMRSGVQHAAAERKVAVAVDVPHAQVFGRKIDLSRLLRNLLDNAVEHAPPGTEVSVQAHRAADVLEVTVEDHGPGIPEAMRSRLFEPFFRGGEERVRSGAGLGLPIAREIAEHVGGSLALTSPERPTRFLVRLPLADG